MKEPIEYCKLDWFGGNEDGVAIYEFFRYLSHTWDDLVDKDVDVPSEVINEAFRVALVYLPANKLYQALLPQILPMWVPIISAYETANKYEKDKDPHGIEIAHGLRYATGHIVAYIITVCVGAEKAKTYLPEMWKSIFYERFDDYRQEHLND